MNRRSFLARALAASAVTPVLSRNALAGGQGAAAQKSIPEVARTVQLCVFDTFGTVVDWHGSVSAEIAASIREFGFTNPILVDERGGIIAGHGRLLAARKPHELNLFFGFNALRNNVGSETLGDKDCSVHNLLGSNVLRD